MIGARHACSALWLAAACSNSGAAGQDAAQPAWESFVAPPDQAPRLGMPVVLLPSERRVIGFGGAHSVDDPPLAETWSLSMRDQSWSRVMVLVEPPARSDHCAVFLPYQNQMLIVGGGDRTSPLPAAALVLDVDTRDWLLVVGDLPTARTGCMAAWHEPSRTAIVFGGDTASGPSNETWQYDPVAATFAPIGNIANAPPARSHGALVADGARLLLYGGVAGAQPLGDLWAFDGTAWSPLTPAAGPQPSARSAALHALDVTRRRWVIFGGRGGATLGDLWRLDVDALTWQPLDVPGGPSARADGASAYDPIEDAYLVLGGVGDGAVPPADGWLLHLP